MRSILLLTTLLLSFSIFSQSFTKVNQSENIQFFLKEKQEEIKTIQANFQEFTTNPMLKEPQKGTGTFLFAAPNKIRWENKSSEIVMLMNGKIVKLYEKGRENKSATAQTVTSHIQGMIVGMINGDFLSNGEYSIEYFQNANNYKLLLTPKNTRMSKEIKQMNLIFNRNTGLLNQLEMVQKGGGTVLYQFEEMKTNKAINHSKFTQL